MSSPTTLFCYGTLCFPDIMLAVCGHRSVPQTASLVGYQCYTLADVVYPAVVPETGGLTQGVMYHGVTLQQQALLDAYEGEQYQRDVLSVRDAQQQSWQAWVYVLRPRYSSMLTSHHWDRQEFAHKAKRAYMQAQGWSNTE